MLELFKALADETRLRILALILEGELCVCEIEACLKLTQSNASRHLTVLKKAGILTSRKSAQWTYYTISHWFREEHAQLCHYLLTQIKDLPSYEEDCLNYQKCKQQNLCNCRNVSCVLHPIRKKVPL